MASLKALRMYGLDVLPLQTTMYLGVVGGEGVLQEVELLLAGVRDEAGII